LIESNKPNLTINYKNINFSKQYNRVIISNNKELNNKQFTNITIDHLGEYDINEKYYLEVLPYSEDDYKKNKNIVTNLDIVWYNSIMFPISLRNRKEGDKIKISSGTKKVKDLLIDEKIPLNQRDNLLLLEKDNEIINIFGVKKSKTLLESKNNNILIVLREKK
jgi:tRNA(Ile)-lysidine synthetase-like protein